MSTHIRRLDRPWQIIAILAVCANISGCKALNTLLHKAETQGRKRRQAESRAQNATAYTAEIETYAARPVDRSGLEAGKIERTAQLLDQMDMKMRHIDVSVEPSEAMKLKARLTAIKRHHAAEAASYVPDPERALRLLSRHFPTQGSTTDVDDEMLEVARRGAAARTEARAQQFRADHTYARQDRDCVFASEPFGGEGVENPGLNYAWRGATKVYARCYLPKAMRDYRRRPGAKFVVKWSGGEETIPDRPNIGLDDHHIDFELDLAHMLSRRVLAAEVMVRVDFSALEGSKLEVEKDALRIRPDAVVEEVSGATLFWER